MIRAELKRLIRLASPLILTQVSQMGMGVADAMMAGRVGATELAGVTLGGNLYWPSMFLVAGMVMALTPTVSQLHGAGRQAEAGEMVRQAWWIGLGGGALLVVFMNNVEPIYQLIGIDPRAIPIAVDYLHALSFGIIQLMMFFSFRYLCEGMSWTTPAMIVGVGALLLKIYLNYVLIYGGTHFGIQVPALGGVGCGWATAIVMNVQMVVMGLVVAFSRVKVANVFSRMSWPKPALMLRLAKLGMPIGLTTGLEIALFASMTLLIGRISVEAVAAHQIAMNVGGLAFMLPLALGMAASIRVGYNVGAGDLAGARLSGWVALAVSAGFAVFAAIVILLWRYEIGGLYSNEQEVIAVAAQLMIFVAFFQLFDDTQTTAIGALRGYKDTKTPMWIALFAYWAVGFPMALVLGEGLLGFEQWGLNGYWTGLTVGLGVAAVALFLRYRWLSRQDHRVLALSAH